MNVIYQKERVADSQTTKKKEGDLQVRKGKGSTHAMKDDQSTKGKRKINHAMNVT